MKWYDSSKPLYGKQFISSHVSSLCVDCFIYPESKNKEPESINYGFITPNRLDYMAELKDSLMIQKSSISEYFLSKYFEKTSSNEYNLKKGTTKLDCELCLYKKDIMISDCPLLEVILHDASDNRISVYTDFNTYIHTLKVLHGSHNRLLYTNIAKVPFELPKIDCSAKTFSELMVGVGTIHREAHIFNKRNKELSAETIRWHTPITYTDITLQGDKYVGLEGIIRDKEKNGLKRITCISSDTINLDNCNYPHIITQSKKLRMFAGSQQITTNVEEATVVDTIELVGTIDNWSTLHIKRLFIYNKPIIYIKNEQGRFRLVIDEIVMVNTKFTRPEFIVSNKSNLRFIYEGRRVTFDRNIYSRVFLKEGM